MYFSIEDTVAYKNIKEIENNCERKYKICSENLHNLIDECMHRDPNERIQFDNLLKHKWFT